MPDPIELDPVDALGAGARANVPSTPSTMRAMPRQRNIASKAPCVAEIRARSAKAAPAAVRI